MRPQKTLIYIIAALLVSTAIFANQAYPDGSKQTTSNILIYGVHTQSPFITFLRQLSGQWITGPNGNDFQLSYVQGQTVQFEAFEQLKDQANNNCAGAAYLISELYSDGCKCSDGGITSGCENRGGVCTGHTVSSTGQVSSGYTYQGYSPYSLGNGPLTDIYGYSAQFALPSNANVGTWSLSSYIYCPEKNPAKATTYSSVDDVDFSVNTQQTTVAGKCGDGIVQYSLNEACDGDVQVCTTADGKAGVQICNLDCKGYGSCTAGATSQPAPTTNTPIISVLSANAVVQGNQVVGTITLQNTQGSMTSPYIVEMQVLPESYTGYQSIISPNVATCNPDTPYNVHIQFTLGAGQTATYQFTSPVTGGLLPGTYKAAFFPRTACGGTNVPGLSISPYGQVNNLVVTQSGGNVNITCTVPSYGGSGCNPPVTPPPVFPVVPNGVNILSIQTTTAQGKVYGTATLQYNGSNLFNNRLGIIEMQVVPDTANFFSILSGEFQNMCDGAHPNNVNFNILLTQGQTKTYNLVAPAPGSSPDTLSGKYKVGYFLATQCSTEGVPGADRLLPGYSTYGPFAVTTINSNPQDQVPPPVLCSAIGVPCGGGGVNAKCTSSSECSNGNYCDLTTGTCQYNQGDGSGGGNNKIVTKGDNNQTCPDPVKASIAGQCIPSGCPYIDSTKSGYANPTFFGLLPGGTTVITSLCCSGSSKTSMSYNDFSFKWLGAGAGAAAGAFLGGATLTEGNPGSVAAAEGGAVVGGIAGYFIGGKLYTSIQDVGQCTSSSSVWFDKFFTSIQKYTCPIAQILQFDCKSFTIGIVILGSTLILLILAKILG